MENDRLQHNVALYFRNNRDADKIGQDSALLGAHDHDQAYRTGVVQVEELRQKLTKDENDFRAQADALRGQLTELGYEVQDSPDGPVVSRR